MRGQAMPQGAFFQRRRPAVIFMFFSVFRQKNAQKCEKINVFFAFDGFLQNKTLFDKISQTKRVVFCCFLFSVRV